MTATFLILNYFELTLSRDRNEAKAFFPWFYKTGMAYTFIMAMGVYYRYEERIDCWMRNGCAIVAAMIYVALIAWS